MPARRDGAAGDYDGLRQNRGGAPNGVTFWLSYLFPHETHLNDIYHGPSGRTRQFWTLAHPTMEITVPMARAVNPVTGGNWEDTGVVPDVEVPVAAAFDTAYRRALEHVLTTSAPASVRAEAEAALKDLPEGVS